MSIELLFYALIGFGLIATFVACYFILKEEDAPGPPKPQDFARQQEQDRIEKERREREEALHTPKSMVGNSRSVNSGC